MAQTANRASQTPEATAKARRCGRRAAAAALVACLLGAGSASGEAVTPPVVGTAISGTAAPGTPLPGAPPPGAVVPEALPGAQPFPAALRQQLERAFATRAERAGPPPRTRHLRADGAPRYTNRLLLEPSPYLQQHAHNPVDWHPWGDEAFALARALDRPVFLSIGYSTCHWCHVMEEESFDDPEIAALLNAGFVAIKVDRELRPDVDAVYMQALLMMRGQGGWPLNLFLTPDREPFFGGTYFPPADREGRRGFPGWLRILQQQYRENREELVGTGKQLAALVREELALPAPGLSSAPDAKEWKAGATLLLSRIDPEWGGIGTRTKFPSTVPVRALLRHLTRHPDEGGLALLTRTLDAMASGGLHDAAGGGFHRYATDPQWRVPHFEKMLYDNALLASDYIEAWRATAAERYRAIALRTLDYLAREMRSPEGGFYSATDADSRSHSGESVEGWFYTWTPAEIDAVLSEEDAAFTKAFYGIDSNGDLDGRNVLFARAPWPDARTRGRLADVHAALYAARAARPPPLRDEKQLTAWNALAISAFAQAASAFGRADHLAIAVDAAEFLVRDLRAEGGGLQRVFLHGRADGVGFLEDHAFTIAALLDLYEAGQDPRHLREAIALQRHLDAHYADEDGGYYETAKGSDAVFGRRKPRRDGATPSGNSVAALNLLRLSEFTSQDPYRERAGMLFSAFHPLLRRAPEGFGAMWQAVDFELGPVKQIVLVGPASEDGGLAELRARTRSSYLPRSILVVATEGAELEAQASVVPWIGGKRALRGRATAYVCENRVCALPTSDPEELTRQLRLRSSSAEPAPLAHATASPTR